MSAKKIILLFHLFFLIVLFVAFLVPSFFYWSFLFFNLLFIFFNNRFRRLVNYKKNIFYLFLPWVFINGLFFYNSLLINKFLILVFIFLGILVLFYYFSALRKYLSRDSALISSNFFIWTDVLALLSVFLVSSFAYGLSYFLNIANLFVILIIISILALSFWQNISVILKDYKKIIFLLFIFVLGFLPLVIALSFLPFNFNILGLILVIFYYSSLVFIRFHLLKNLTIKKIKYNLLFIIALFLFIILTVKWR